MAPVGQLGDGDGGLILGEEGVGVGGGGGNDEGRELAGGGEGEKKTPLVVLLWLELAENLRAKTKITGRDFSRCLASDLLDNLGQY